MITVVVSVMCAAWASHSGEGSFGRSAVDGPISTWSWGTGLWHRQWEEQAVVRASGIVIYNCYNHSCKICIPRNVLHTSSQAHICLHNVWYPWPCVTLSIYFYDATIRWAQSALTPTHTLSRHQLCLTSIPVICMHAHTWAYLQKNTQHT